MVPLDTLTGMQGQPPDDYGDQPQEMEAQGFPEPGTEPDYPGATPVDYNINWDRERRDQFARYLCDEIDRWHEQVYKRVPVTEVEMDEKAFHALVVAGLDPLQAQLQALKKDAQGRDVVTLTHENVLVFDATKFKTIPFEDGVLFPPTVRDPLDAIGIGERVVI